MMYGVRREFERPGVQHDVIVPVAVADHDAGGEKPAHRETGERQRPPLRGTRRRAGPQLRHPQTDEPRHADGRQIEVAFGENVGPHPVGIEDGSQRGKEPHDREGSEADVSFAAAPADQEKRSEREEDQQAGENAKIEQARARVENVEGAKPHRPEELARRTGRRARWRRALFAAG